MSLSAIDRVRSAEVDQASHVLVVDDDRNYTTILRSLLEGEGYTVTTAASARTALDYLEHTDYDIILLDVVMPEMSGLDLCRLIRETSRVPILFVTVCSAVADKVRGLRAGADGYITKPFDPDEVLARIRVQLRRSAWAKPEVHASSAFLPAHRGILHAGA